MRTISVGITLPTKLSEPKQALSDFSILVYGSAKIGKTTLAAMFPEALFLMCEPGGKALRIYQQPIQSWREILDVLGELRKSKQFRTVVVDTVDLAYRMCEEDICKKLGISHASEKSYGGAWGMIRSEFQTTMARLQNLNRGVIFISHAHEVEVRRRSGSVSHRTAPTLGGIGYDVLDAMADFIVYYDRTDSGERALWVRSEGNITAGIRTGVEEAEKHFLWTDGTEIESIPMGKSPQEGYNNFIAAFENKLEKGGKVVSATTKPVQKKLTIRRV